MAGSKTSLVLEAGIQRFLIFLSTLVVAAVGLTLTLVFQAMIPSRPEMKDILIWASIASFVVLSCLGPIAITMVHSYRVHGSLRPALRTIAWFFVVGVIWSALTNKHDDDHDR